MIPDYQALVNQPLLLLEDLRHREQEARHHAPARPFMGAFCTSPSHCALAVP